ncbi:MAG TPA: integrase arm-type DNA-binding domain-containing protein [Novosphingobium sp.]|nr:integrase arm-type DNA-binding domain-containing protein [Novosphingobium sp.]
MAKKVTLTPASIDALQKGILADLLTPGLAIEVLGSGRKRWRYRRQVAGTDIMVTMFGQAFPAQTIAAAREWARELNTQTEAGIDPRVVLREERVRASMTVARAHALYMRAVCEGRSSRAKRQNKPRTIKDKLGIYTRDIAPTLAKRSIYEVTEVDLIRLVEAKGKCAKVRANRLAAELKVFFGWAASLRGLEVGLTVDPSRRLGDLRFPETARARKLSLLELEWFLQALVAEERDFQRGMLLWLLTAARITEVAQARSDEVVDGVWTIPAGRAKNAFAHSIALGPWGRSLMASASEWIFPAIRIDGPRNNSVWYAARDRVRARMEKIAGRPIERFTPHDFRRTARSNTKRLKVDYETAEAMLNHVKKGLERTYDLYEMEDEKRAWFLKWEQEVADIARRAGVAIALGVPGARASQGYAFSLRLAQRSQGRSAPHLAAFVMGATPGSAQVATRLVFAWGTRQALAQTGDAAPGGSA